MRELSLTYWLEASICPLISLLTKIALFATYASYFEGSN